MDAPTDTIFESLRSRADRRGEELMRAAIACAERPLTSTSPNPRVGCVVATPAGEIVGEGWHKGAGTDHAETMALKDAGSDAKGAIAFVTLEPCNHTGRTGPCTRALIDADVAEVVYAVDDPNPIAAGGSATIREAGIHATGGFLKDEASFVNRAWLKWIAEQRPYVTAKIAMSLDGRTATQSGESQWITGEAARRAGHAMRANADAILVGAGTIVADDPALTARLEQETRDPLRVVLDTSGRTPFGAKAYERSGPGALLVTTNQIPEARAKQYRNHGVEIAKLIAGPDGRPDLDALLDELGSRDIQSLMIEGGGEVIGAFFDGDLLDEIHIFTAPKLIGGGAPAFGGCGIEELADAENFDVASLGMVGEDFHFRALRKERH